jgi:hypothetical protein
MDWLAPSLGSGLGNRLFQHAAAAGLAEKWGKHLQFLISRCTESPHGPLATLFRMYPQVPLVDAIDPYTEFKEPPRGYYDYKPFSNTPPQGNVVLQGFRQSPLYFPKNLALLQPNWDSALGGSLVRALIERDADLATLEERARTVSLHVRLGDYTKLAHHQVDLGGYYMKALEKLTPGSRIHLFSDEPDRCAQQFAAYARAHEFVFTVAKPRSDVEALYEMSLCIGGNIVANSTFSWWGAWFAHASGSPWATFPNNWGRGMPKPTDLFPEWATVLPV